MNLYNHKTPLGHQRYSIDCNPFLPMNAYNYKTPLGHQRCSLDRERNSRGQKSKQNTIPS